MVILHSSPNTAVGVWLTSMVRYGWLFPYPACFPDATTITLSSFHSRESEGEAHVRQCPFPTARRSPRVMTFRMTKQSEVINITFNIFYFHFSIWSLLINLRRALIQAPLKACNWTHQSLIYAKIDIILLSVTTRYNGLSTLPRTLNVIRSEAHSVERARLGKQKEKIDLMMEYIGKDWNFSGPRGARTVPACDPGRFNHPACDGS
jgi:hypothetical protein